MQQSNQVMRATGGREASRERRMRLAQGKAALPAAVERTRTGERSAVIETAAPMALPANIVTTTTAVAASAPSSPALPATSGTTLVGRTASQARRAALVQGKAALQQATLVLPTANVTSPATPTTSPSSSAATNSRKMAQAMRAERARNGRGDNAPARPSGRVREPKPIQYPPKVADTRTYAGQKVTGVRIGHGTSVTGDEPGAALPVTGTQYIGTESGYMPRPGGVKVGAARTAGGLVVTGSQVRNTVKITGDESNPALRITGEADQEIADDLIQRDEQGVYTGAQFQRMHDPHGQSVFGGNLGRSAKTMGSRERNRERALEQSENGLPITGTALGRSVRVTGDEPGSCRTLTGDQYLMPAGRQALCEVSGGRTGVRTAATMGMNGRPDPVTGEKVTVSESWSRQRITGVAVEHNSSVTGAEPGVCSTITGTPYVGPGEVEAHCDVAQADAVVQRVTPGLGAGNRVTGNIALNVQHVTGTQRGGERTITGTAYYRAESQAGVTENSLDRINARFSVRSPQREAQLRADPAAVQAPSAASRITGTFAAGEGKITGNQEFHFAPRPKTARVEDKSRVTGEGRMEGPPITGGAWDAQSNVTGTEGHIAAERNPSESHGKPQAFASATQFKGKGNHRAPTQHITGMVGWSAKTAARVTLSGGAQG